MVELTKDWSIHKKGDTVDLKDSTVLTKGLSIGLFKEVKAKQKKK